MALASSTVAAISIATTVASTAFSVVGAYQQSKSAQAQAEYQAQVARNNATIAQQDAAALQERSKIAEQDHRQRVAATISSAKSAAAANGFLVDGNDDDTNVLLTASLAEAGELDILRMRDETALRKRNLDIAAMNSENQAGLFQARADAENPLFAAGSTLLEGAARTAGAAYNAGMFSSSSGSSGASYRNPLAGTSAGRRYGLNSPSGF
jgi:hypothetical protein